jgi:hypothetical protein
MHSSRQLLALQDSSMIPLQREGSLQAGEGRSQANALRAVQIEIDIDTTQEVLGRKKKSLGTLWEANAAKVYQAFDVRYGPKEAPKQMAWAFLDQGIIKKRLPPANKTVICQVAPSLGLRVAYIREKQEEIEQIKRFITIQETVASREQIAEMNALEKLIEEHNFATKDEVSDYFFAVDAGMQALIVSKKQDGKTGLEVYYPAGWFGTGASSIPAELAAITQLTLASTLGINMVFHNFVAFALKEKRTAQFERAKEYFRAEILPLIAAGAMKGRILEKIQQIALREKWPLDDL